MSKLPIDPTSTDTRFLVWVREIGIAEVVDRMCKLGPEYAVTMSAVYQHMRGDVQPRLPKIQGYVRLAAGRLTLNDINEHFESRREARDRVRAAMKARQ